MLYLLDADVVIDYLHGIERAVRFVQSLRHAGQGIALTAVVIAEVFVGTRPDERERVRAFLSAFARLDPDEEAAERAGSMRHDFLRLGRSLALTDLLIATTAIQHGATLVTRNVRDYPIADLNVLSPY